MAEMLGSYFTNAALNIGGDHVSCLAEEDDSFRSIPPRNLLRK